MRRNVIGGAVGAVDDDLEAPQVHLERKGALAELDVTPVRIVDPPRTTETGRGHTGQRLVECCLDLQLHVIRELGARSREELDSVVVVGVVRRGNDDPGAQAQGSGKVRDGWCGHRPDETDIDTGCRQTCLQRRFHHVAGNPGVLSNQDRRTLSRLDVTTRIVLCGENSARCVTQTHDEIGCYRDVSDATTHAVGTKILS